MLFLPLDLGGILAIFLIYGVDVNMQGVLTKGNIDQTILEVENLSRLSKVYISTTDSQSYSNLFNGKAEHLSSKLFSLPGTTLGRLLGSAIFFVIGFVSITRRLKEVEVIVTNGTTALQGAVANFLFRKPHITFLHYFAYDEQFLLKRQFLPYLFRIVELFLIRYSNCVIAPNEVLQTKALGHGAKSVQIIPNFVEIKRINKMDDRGILRKKLGFNDSSVILFVGRLHPVKNVDLLLRAFERIDRLREHILVIIGDGPEKQRLVDLANSLNISKRVFFEGFKAKDAVLEYMKASNVLVLPSSVEGQPRVVLEAWACELPVVASRRPGLKTLINDRVDGLLFDLGDEDGLTEAISVALDRKTAVKIASNAKRKAAQYDVAKVLSDQRNVVMGFLQRN